MAVFEAGRIGAGSSGHTGGIALPETAAGDMPGLGDVLGGFRQILETLGVKCDFETGGVYEVSHRSGQAGFDGGRSPEPFGRGRSKQRPDGSVDDICWADSGELRVAKEVPGGSVDPGKLVGELGRAAERLGAMIFENSRVERIEHGKPLVFIVRGREIRARRGVVATNAMALELSGLAGRAEPKFTLAVETERLTARQLGALGLAERRPFYTVDLPYLWGRVLPTNRVIFGSGLVHLENWRGLETISINEGEAAELIGGLEERVRGLHPALRNVKFRRRWGGPMLIGAGWKPVFMRHAASRDLLVLGAYSGHGVALSVYLGRWAAEVLLGRRRMPEWSKEAKPGRTTG